MDEHREFMRRIAEALECISASQEKANRLTEETLEQNRRVALSAQSTQMQSRMGFGRQQ
jgi:uncharacterized protein YdiU (UPF0061 family)